MKRLRFHWSMSAAGDPDRATKPRSAASGVPDIEAHIEFCRVAEQCGRGARRAANCSGEAGVVNRQASYLRAC